MAKDNKIKNKQKKKKAPWVFAPDGIPKSSPKRTQPIKSQVKALRLI